MGAHILKKGWDNWRNPENEKTSFYAEYKSTGAGGNSKERVKWSHQLKDKDLKKFTLEHIFGRHGSWDPTFK